MRTNTLIEGDASERETPATGAQTARSAGGPAPSSPIPLAEQDDIRGLRGKLPWTGNLDKMRCDQ